MGRAREKAVVYWLVPAPAERELFCSLIRILSKELEAPLFEPHLALFSSSQDRSSARKAVQKLQARRFSLTIRDVQFSAAFTKTLFVRFRRSGALDDLISTLQRAAGKRFKKISEPHLSLCYKKLPASAKRELVSAIKLPLRGVVFGCVQAVLCPMPTRTAAEVKAWKVIGRKMLSD